MLSQDIFYSVLVRLENGTYHQLMKIFLPPVNPKASDINSEMPQFRPWWKLTCVLCVLVKFNTNKPQ